MRMIKPLVGLVFALALTCVGNAQAQVKLTSDNTSPADVNVATPFSSSSASQVILLDPSAEGVQTSTFVLAVPANAIPADPAPAALPAAPDPKPRYILGDRDDYRWQLALGVEFIRFQSSRIDASLVGLNTTITYFTNDWFAVEGNLVTGFAPTIYEAEHVKYFGGAGGIRIGTRRARFEPWGHALVGAAIYSPKPRGAIGPHWKFRPGWFRISCQRPFVSSSGSRLDAHPIFQRSTKQFSRCRGGRFSLLDSLHSHGVDIGVANANCLQCLPLIDSSVLAG